MREKATRNQAPKNYRWMSPLLLDDPPLIKMFHPQVACLWNLHSHYQWTTSSNFTLCSFLQRLLSDTHVFCIGLLSMVSLCGSCSRKTRRCEIYPSKETSQAENLICLVVIGVGGRTASNDHSLGWRSVSLTWNHWSTFYEWVRYWHSVRKRQ